MLAVSAEKKSRSGNECGKHMVRITFRRSGLLLSPGSLHTDGKNNQRHWKGRGGRMTSKWNLTRPDPLVFCSGWVGYVFSSHAELGSMVTDIHSER